MFVIFFNERVFYQIWSCYSDRSDFFYQNHIVNHIVNHIEEKYEGETRIYCVEEKQVCIYLYLNVNVCNV